MDCGVTIPTDDIVVQKETAPRVEGVWRTGNGKWRAAQGHRSLTIDYPPSAIDRRHGFSGLKNKKARQLTAYRAKLGRKGMHALAVFITRPQADYQIGALRKNN
jgi:hypothetical protein